MGGLNLSAPLGMSMTAVNWASMSTAGTEAGSLYRNVASFESFAGPTASLVNDTLDLMQEPFTNKMTDERTALKVKSFILMQNGAIIDEALKATAKEIF